MTYLNNSNIPEEYKEQIAQLIESNDENNWDLVYELIKGFDISGLSKFGFMCQFRAILGKYRYQTHINDAIYYKVGFYLNNKHERI